MPDGLYFLTSVTVFKSGNRYHSGWLRSPRIPKLNDGESNGKYIDIIKVNARKTLSPVIYQPIWGHGHDPRRNQVRFFNAFEREGAMHIINAYEKEQNNQRKLLEQARLNNSHKTSKTSAARARVIIKIRCPGCTSLNDENAKFCNQCGKRQITVPESTKPDK
jgi:hypothetical protein